MPALAVWCPLAGAALAETTLVEATFDGDANDTNNTFGIISNSPSRSRRGSWNQATGRTNRGSSANSTCGAVSATTIDIADSIPGNLTYLFVRVGIE